MKKIAQHHLLLAGESMDQCKDQVTRFFEQTSLVRYDRITISEENCLNALDAVFFTTLDRLVRKNKETIHQLLAELKTGGLKEVDSIAEIRQGYLSKTFHLLSHFLDGFIGIDSQFYNLLDDSHWVPDNRIAMIRRKPSEFWLISCEGYAMDTSSTGILRL